MRVRLEDAWDDLIWWLGGHRAAVAVPVVLAGLAAIFVFVPVPGIPCDVSPAKSCAPADDAIDLVPEGALAYLHVDTDSGSSQLATARDVAGKLPGVAGIEQTVFAQLGAAPGVELRRDIAPWIGDEAAVAELGPRRQRPLALLAIGDAAAEKRFLAGLGKGAPREVRQGSAVLHVFPDRLAYAELNGFLALGPAPAVSAAIAVAAGKVKSLADSDAATAARDSLPDQRFADAYLSEAGIARLLRGRGSFAAQLDTFVDFDASDGIAAALVAHGDGLELQLDSQQAPVRSTTHPSFFGAFPPFDPSLAGEFSPDTVLYLDFAKPADTLRALLRQARKTAPGLALAAGSFERQLRSAGAGLESGLLPALGGEAAAGVVAGRDGPYLTLAFDGVDEARARTEMAQLQAPLIQALEPQGSGGSPSFSSKSIGDVSVHTVSISPALAVSYAIFDGKLVIATNPAGVSQAIEGGQSLATSDGFKAATDGASGGVSALVFLGLQQLAQAQPLGLGQAVGGFSADLAKVKALGLSVRSDEDSLKTTLFLNIE